MLERGVRFVELTCVAGIRNVSPWDSHSNIRVEHQKNADIVDRPIAALLKDLKARGLWTTRSWSGPESLAGRRLPKAARGAITIRKAIRSGLPAAVFAAG